MSFNPKVNRSGLRPLDPLAHDKRAGLVQYATSTERAAGARQDRVLAPADVATAAEALDSTDTRLATVAGVAANQAAKNRMSYIQFKSNPVSSAKGGGASAGTDTAANSLILDGEYMECYNVGTQTIIDPVQDGTGFDIARDQTDNEGSEFGFGILAGMKHAYTIGTSAAFRIEGKFTVADVSGADPLFIGFRKVQAYQADFNDYTDMAVIGLGGGDNPSKINIYTILNNASTVTTDTTDTLADGIARYFRIDVTAAGVVTFSHGASIAALAAPTATKAFTFDDTDVVVPVISCIQGSDLTGAVYIDDLYVGLQADYTAK